MTTIDVTIEQFRKTLLDGLAGGEATTQVTTFDVSKKQGTKQALTMSGFTTTYNTEENVTTTYTAKDAGGNVLFQHTKTVKVQSNYVTNITGELFSASKAAIMVNNDAMGEFNVAL